MLREGDDSGTSSEEAVSADSSRFGEVTRNISGSVTSAAAGVQPVEVRTLGRYMVIEELGRGGMGIVLRAYDPRLHREVALKYVHPSALSGPARARMIREAQALAQLNHRNVVSVYDVEELDGSVVLAMELVVGSHLGDWVRKKTPSPAEVIWAYVEAGRGLQAAHEVGLLHRDFKPSNVLRTTSGEVKVIDFGLARFEGDEVVPLPGSSSVEQSTSTTSAPITVAGEIMGTPPFMAPEQHSGGELGAAADQYAFCVSLWSALAGRLPFRAPQGLRQQLALKQAGPPPWPSEAPRIPRAVVRALERGMAWAPEERWPTLGALLDELGRDHAAPRRRLMITTGLALALGGGLGWHAYRRSQTEAACEAEGRAIDELWNPSRADALGGAFAATTLSFASDTWDHVRPRVDSWAEQWADTRTSTCRAGTLDGSLEPERLAQTRACLDEQRTRMQTLLEGWAAPTNAAVRRAASVAWSLPRVEDCTDPHTLRQYENAGDPEQQRRTQELTEELARLQALAQLGRAKEAMEMARAAHATAVELGDQHQAAALLRRMGLLEDAQGEREQAQKSLEASFSLAEQAGDDLLGMMVAADLIRIAGYERAHYDAGRLWVEVANGKRLRLGLPEDSLVVADILNHEGMIAMAEERYDEARETFERTIALRERLLGPDAPAVGAAINNLGLVQLAVYDFPAARKSYERAAAIWERALGTKHPQLATAFINLGSVLLHLGEHELAESTLLRAATLIEDAFGPDHADLGYVYANLGDLYTRRGELQKAKEIYQRAIAVLERTEGPEHIMTGRSLSLLAETLWKLGEKEAARQASKRALAIFERSSDHVDTSHVLGFEGRMAISEGRLDEAVELIERSRSLREAAMGADHFLVGKSLRWLGVARREQGRPAEALALLERALAITQRDDGSAGMTAEIQLELARTLDALGQDPARARQLAERALTHHPEPAVVQQWLDGHPPGQRRPEHRSMPTTIRR